jgi:multidrug efflux pump subunit AcrB
VFFPVTLFYGVSRYLFGDLALGVVLSIFASYIFALTVVPLYCARFIRMRAHDETSDAKSSGVLSNVVVRFNAGFHKLLQFYETWVTRALARPGWTTAYLLGGIALTMAVVFPFVGKAYFPRTDPGQFVINVKAPTGTRLELTDKYVARVEDDIILQSQVRELGAFQQLIEGRAESDDKLLGELIEQWVVETEATASHFPQPAESEVDRELTRIRQQFTSSEKYAFRLNELGLTADEVRQLLIHQIYVERYVDYKFRPSVQVDPAEIQAYYEKELLPELAKNKQPAPDRAAVEPQIRELLIQRGISNLTSKWLDDTKSRLKIEMETAGKQP